MLDGRGYAGKVVDFKRMTKNPNPVFFIFLNHQQTMCREKEP